MNEFYFFIFSLSHTKIIMSKCYFFETTYYSSSHSSALSLSITLQKSVSYDRLYEWESCVGECVY